MCNIKRIISDRWNSKWRLPPFWIYYFCPFWSNDLFPVATLYITAKFHSSTSIGGWVIDVCAKIQDSGCCRLELYFCNAGPPAKSICAHENSLQISCWSSAYFSRYRNSKISQIWLKMPIQAPQKSCFWGVLTLKHYFLLSRPSKGPTLRGNTRFEP